MELDEAELAAQKEFDAKSVAFKAKVFRRGVPNEIVPIDQRRKPVKRYFISFTLFFLINISIVDVHFHSYVYCFKTITCFQNCFL